MTTYTAKYPDAPTGLAHQYTDSGTSVTATGRYDYVSMTNTGGTATAPITATQSGGYGAYFEMRGFFNLVRANGAVLAMRFRWHEGGKDGRRNSRGSFGDRNS